MFETLFSMGSKESNLIEGRKKKKAAIIIGAWVPVAVGLAYLPEWATPLPSFVNIIITLKTSILFKLRFLNSKWAVTLLVAKSLLAASKVVFPFKASGASASAVKTTTTADKAFGFLCTQGFVRALQHQIL